ncbi:transcriptional regulator [Arthrobacter sp. UCD-GKA]|jgi:DNA-binding transcriptional ArsR family regulator|uniref:ArsR/SmtB family transcription factor n=1 Tax=Arthrobacter sp. UCD-GKA TaxID=1913576 RepID=UPI0008DE72FC|nr:helix-turn-helix transcriptional regulator [Arthrobacter sp. UCD-GKA]OIH85299.1 transcriptional regulator [Arthrobacter sp. UCD-GKA]
MRALAHPTQAEMQLDTVLSALSDPVRRQIVGQLANASIDQACSAFQLPISKSTSTYHFRVLREAGLIEQRYSGTTILNTLRAADLEARFPGLLRAVLRAARSETTLATSEVE